MCDYMLSHKYQTEGQVRVLHDFMCYSFQLAVGNFWCLYLIYCCEFGLNRWFYFVNLSTSEILHSQIRFKVFELI